jgi:hypothetical protein
MGFDGNVPNDNFKILAADHVERGINLSSNEGQRALDPLLIGVDLLIVDNLSTLSTFEAASPRRRRSAHPSCRGERSPAGHIATRRRLGHGYRAATP